MAKIVRINGTKLADIINGTDLKEKIKAKAGADVINGGSGNDKINAGNGDDIIVGGLGNDTIDGDKGIDTAVFSGTYESYALSFSQVGNLRGTVSGGDGVDNLKNVEFLQFDNAIYDVENDIAYVINPVNHPPVVRAPLFDATVEDGHASALDALTYASDPDPGTTLQVVDLPATLPAGLIFTTFGGSFVFFFDPSDAAYQHLADGALITVTVSYGVSDGIATTMTSATWSINGRNDAPEVTGPVVGNATEDGAIVTLDALVNASDVDDGDVLDIGNIPGVLPAGVSFDHLAQSFSLDPAHAGYQYLAEHEMMSVSLNYVVADRITASPASLTWTVAGVNDAPLITETILDEPVFGETSAQLSGTILFQDADLSDSHQVQVFPQGSDYVGTFNAVVASDSTGSGAGTVGLLFQVDFADVQVLGPGPHPQTYTIVLSDGHGGVVSTEVTIPLGGGEENTNHAPILYVDIPNGDTPFGFVSDTPGLGNILEAQGTLSFNDEDIQDTHFASAIAEPDTWGFLFDASVAQDTTGSGTGGVVNWHYQVNTEPLVRALGQDQFHDDHFFVNLSDGPSTASQAVIVRIAGNNDTPFVDGPAMTEIRLPTTTHGPLTIANNIGYHDYDTFDFHSVNVVFQPGGGGPSPLGTFSTELIPNAMQEPATLGPSSGGLIHWSYTVDPSAWTAASGNNYETFQIVVMDEHGASAFSTVRVFYDLIV